MEQDPYDKYGSDDLILRDWLAMDRTVLANERTFLAYIRTSLAVFIVGAGLFAYFETGHYADIGLAMLPLGAIIFFVGLYRFIETRNSLYKLYIKKDKPMKKKKENE